MYLILCFDKSLPWALDIHGPKIYDFIAISFLRNILCNNALNDCYSDQAIALESKSQCKNQFQINFHQVETKAKESFYMIS